MVDGISQKNSSGHCQERATPLNLVLFVLMKYGISFKNQIDMIGERSGNCVLTIIQYDEINGANIELLQAKLNQYLSYILDGQLEEEDIKKHKLPKVIELVLGHEPTSILQEFISHARHVLEFEEIDFVLVMNENDT